MDAPAGGFYDGDAGLAALRDTLTVLHATAPRLVCRKSLNRQDVSPNQARLLIPRAALAGAAAGDELEAFLTAEEMERVRVRLGLTIGDHGMQVATFNRHGHRYDMKLKYMDHCSVHFRLCGHGWIRFVRGNQLEEAMAEVEGTRRAIGVEVWAFRSSELPRDGGVELHPDGALGLAIVIRD